LALVYRFVADTDGKDFTPVTAQRGDDGASLTGGSAEIKDAEEEFEIAAC
jgi:hypothetical protein